MNKKEFSPDLNHLIERVPDRFNTLLVGCLFIFVMGLILAGFIIESPERINADIRISSSNPPIVLKAKVSGKIDLLIDSLPQYRLKDQYIAVIENSGNPNDIKSLWQYHDSYV